MLHNIVNIIRCLLLKSNDILKYNLRKIEISVVMQMINVLETITKYRLARNWTEYHLAERSGLPQSTISSWYRKNMMPSIPSLEKICNAFDITISQFFAEESVNFALTPLQKEFLKDCSRLDKKQQQALLCFLKTL